MDALKIKIIIRRDIDEEGIEEIIKTIGKKYGDGDLEGIHSIIYLTPSKNVDVDRAIEYIRNIPSIHDVSRYYG